MARRLRYIARKCLPEDGDGFGVYKVHGYDPERGRGWTGMSLIRGPFSTLEAAIESNGGCKDRVIQGFTPSRVVI